MMMPLLLTNSQDWEAFAVFIIASIILLGLWAIGFFDFIGAGWAKGNKRIMVHSYRWPPNFPLPQLIIGGRTFDYDDYVETSVDESKNISIGKLYYMDGGERMLYSETFDLDNEMRVDPVRTFKQRRIYANIITERDKDPKDKALELARVRADNAEKINRVLLAFIKRQTHSKAAQRLHAEMEQGMYDTGRTTSSSGIKPEPKPVQLGQPGVPTQPQQTDDDEEAS